MASRLSASGALPMAGSQALPGATAICDVCGSSTSLTQLMCLKCGSRRPRALQREGSVRVHGAEPRRPSVVLPPEALGVVVNARVPQRPVLSREATAAKLKESVVTSDGLQQTVMALAERMQAMELQMQEEIRQRYKLENLVMRCTEDLLRLKGVKLTNEEIQNFVRRRTNFLDTISERWKIDFDHVDFGDQIGSGGFSEVYDGKYNGEDVAIKKLRVSMFGGEEGADTYLEELEKEVQLMSELEHPCILRFVGVCLWPSYYILTELVRNGTLDEFLHGGEAFAWSDRLSVLLQVSSALHYLHHLDPPVVHLDLKPQNVLLNIDQGGFHALLSDFGISLRKDTVIRSNVAERALQFKALSAITQSGALPTFAPALQNSVGTPLHVAPEIALKRPFNERADIYSFGMLLWSVITRERIRMPGGPTLDIHAIYQPPIPAYVPAPVAELIRACWNDAALNRPDISRVVARLTAFKDENYTFAKN